MDHEKIAEAAHKAMAQAALTDGEYVPAWEFASEDEKRKAIQFVALLEAKPDLTPEDAHDAWVRSMKHAGWRWGPKTDREKKTNILLLPYSVLGPIHIAKDEAVYEAIREGLASDEAGTPDTSSHQ